MVKTYLQVKYSRCFWLKSYGGHSLSPSTQPFISSSVIHPSIHLPQPDYSSSIWNIIKLLVKIWSSPHSLLSFYSPTKWLFLSIGCFFLLAFPPSLADIIMYLLHMTPIAHPNYSGRAVVWRQVLALDLLQSSCGWSGFPCLTCRIQSEYACCQGNHPLLKTTATIRLSCVFFFSSCVHYDIMYFLLWFVKFRGFLNMSEQNRSGL